MCIFKATWRGFVPVLLAGLFGLPIAAASDMGVPVPPGKALIYVIQGETGNFTSVSVFIDGRNIGRVKANSYLAVAADPGMHQLSSAGVSTASIPISLDAGSRYYVSQRINAQSAPEFRLLSVSEGQQLLARTTSARDDVVVVGPGSPVQTPTAAPVSQSVTAPVSRPAPDSERSRPAGRDHVAVILKTGAYSLSNATQNVVSLDTTFKAPSSVLGGEVEYQFANGFAVGGELFGYKSSFTQTGGSSGTMTVSFVLLNAKKYFAVTRMLRPFVGVGVGRAGTGFSGSVTGSTTGSATKFMGGLELRFDNVGLYLELNSVGADTKDTAGQTVKVGGTGKFVGVSVHF